MVKALNTLIKISEYELEEKRKELNNALSQKENFITEIKHLEEAFEAEKGKSEKVSIELKSFLPRFLALTRNKQQILIEQIERLNPEIERLTDELYEIFVNNKKYEILREQKLEEMAEELAKKNQLELDEIAMIKFMKNENL